MNYKIVKEFVLKEKFNLIFFEQVVTSGTSFIATILIINLINIQFKI